MNEYRFTVSMLKHGARDVAKANAESVLEAFYEEHPEVGAVVTARSAEDKLDVTYSYTARTNEKAIDKGGDIFIDAITKTELDPVDIEFQVELLLKPRKASPKKPRRKRDHSGWDVNPTKQLHEVSLAR